jgi:hypothetical protein
MPESIFYPSPGRMGAPRNLRCSSRVYNRDHAAGTGTYGFKLPALGRAPQDIAPGWPARAAAAAPPGASRADRRGAGAALQRTPPAAEPPHRQRLAGLPAAHVVRCRPWAEAPPRSAGNARRPITLQLRLPSQCPAGLSPHTQVPWEHTSSTLRCLHTTGRDVAPAAAARPASARGTAAAAGPPPPGRSPATTCRRAPRRAPSRPRPAVTNPSFQLRS